METQKTHWREFHPTEYIGAYAFEPGEEKVLTIKRAKHERVKDEKGKQEDCLVVHWKEPGIKPMIVNVTNSKAISKVAGSPYIEEWTGVAVTLFTMEVSAFGETVEAVRVRQTKPKVKPALFPGHEKWDRAVKSVADGKTTIERVKRNYDLSEADETAMKEAVAELATEEVA